jgi:hypothetical protein
LVYSFHLGPPTGQKNPRLRDLPRILAPTDRYLERRQIRKTNIAPEEDDNDDNDNNDDDDDDAEVEEGDEEEAEAEEEGEEDDEEVESQEETVLGNDEEESVQSNDKEDAVQEDNEEDDEEDAVHGNDKEDAIQGNEEEAVQGNDENERSESDVVQTPLPERRDPVGKAPTPEETSCYACERPDSWDNMIVCDGSHEERWYHLRCAGILGLPPNGTRRSILV